MYAASLARRAAAPVRLTPRGVGVGAVMLGDGELLVELDGYSPGNPALHRIALPPADEPAVAWTVPPMPQPDSPPPAGSVGATVRIYIEKYQPPGDEEALGAETAQALAPLVDLALELTQIAELTGRDAPTVIT